jgi:hypothetical protein
VTCQAHNFSIKHQTDPLAGGGAVSMSKALGFIFVHVALAIYARRAFARQGNGQASRSLRRR